MKAEVFEKRRKELYSQIDKPLLIFSGKKITNPVGNEYPFEVDRDFFYLTGIDNPDCIYIYCNNEETLFIPITDELTAKWMGSDISFEEAKKISNIKSIIDIKDFEEFFSKLKKKDFLIPMKSGRDNKVLPLDNDFYIELKAKYNLNYMNAQDFIRPKREVKSNEEVVMIEEAAKTANNAYLAVLDMLKDGVSEKQIEGELEYRFKREHKEVGFNTIVASGKNAAVLHYSKAKDIAKDGELLLMDFGCTCEKYSSDVTRTVPVSGKFSPRQRTLYEIVLKANKKIIEEARIGLTTKDLNNIVIELYKSELKNIGLIKEDSEVSEYYYHGVSHSLGLEVHDVHFTETPLKEGNVITVEPGLYIAKEGIGIRIEDDVLITKGKAKVLTSMIIKEADDIENYMSKK